MNIFQLDKCPINSAQMMVDKHVVKMILETAQLLSTAHRVIDGTLYYDTTASGRKVKRWLLPDYREYILYKATHVNHPSAVWARETNNNYNWLFSHFCGLINEYTYRYEKNHKCEELLGYLSVPPRNISIGHLRPIAQAMPEQYRSSDPISSYRNYYKYEKKHLHSWTRRSPPDWIKENSHEHSAL